MGMKQWFGRGFTIIELLIVIVIIGVLITLVAVAYSGIQNSARDNAVLSDLDALDGIETQYGLQHGVAGKAWDSTDGIDSDLNFEPSTGNVVSVTVNDDDYCIQIYNPTASTYNSLESAAIKESSSGACETINTIEAPVITLQSAYCNYYPGLQWNEVSGIDSYQVELSLDAVFTSPDSSLITTSSGGEIDYSDGIITTNNYFGSLPNPTTWWARVASVGSQGQSDWSNVLTGTYTFLCM